ncbi:MAG: peptidoglycan DD-metalloendopeptidase family protein [Leptolinea sp.]|nr:peptidoglycan DD-metalloendopeptidase family protein [Leptolinea sp.]
MPQPETVVVEQPAAGDENTELIKEATPLPRREQYFPGQLVDYIARSGDTLPGLAAHFNTTIKEIHQANPVIPDDASTMPQGFPMKIPIYYQSLWGTPFQILPDSLFVYGPAQKDFDPVNYVKNQPGWFKNYTFYTSGANRTGGEIINLLAQNYSISPRLLLALIEYQAGGLSQPVSQKDIDEYPLGFRDFTHKGLFLQLSWAANYLNNGYYDWRTGNLKTFDLQNGRLERPDPWQNAATVGLQYYFARVLNQNEYEQAISADGFFQTYKALFGDPWIGETINIPGSLKQPKMHFPFPTGKTWTYTGGPHSPYGNDSPRAALDFAPPSVIGGCVETTEIVVAVADGIVSRTDTGIAVLDLDGDGDERTGWVVFYLHLATADMVKTGTRVKAGDRMGRPSCEGGHSTGTHIHIARKYNGEWIPADGPIPFDLEGWLAGNGSEVYQGTLTRYSRTVNACECSDSASQITSEVTCP